MTEEQQSLPNNQQDASTLLDKAALSLADAQESSRKAQELKEQLASGRSAVEALISSLFAAVPAADAAFDAVVAEAAAEQEQVEEQLESLEQRLDTVFDLLEDITGPAALPENPLPPSVETPAVQIATVEAVAEAPAEAAASGAAALPEWFSLPAGFASLADLAADVDAKLHDLGEQLEEKAEQAAIQLEEAGEKAELKLADTLQQTLQQVSAGLAALGIVLPDDAAEDTAKDADMEAVFAAVVEAEIEEDSIKESIEEENIAEEAPAAAAAAVTEETVSIPLQEIVASYPGYNPTWKALAQQDVAVEPMEAPTAPLAEVKEESTAAFAPAWFKATEEKEMAAVKSVPAAEAPVFAPPVIDEDDPVEIAARAMEARRLEAETEKMAAQLAEAERVRRKAEEELRRILQELEGEKQNRADDDIAALLRGFKN